MPFEVTPMVVTPTAGAYPLGGSGDSGYPGPQAAAPNNGYPAPEATATSGDPNGRANTALEGLAVAQEAASKELSPDAKLYAIVPSRIMIINLGSPPVVAGWFYKFKVPGSPRELVVQVVDNAISGTTAIEPIEPPAPAELPIDLDKVKLDSDEVYAKFVEKAPELGLTVSDPKSYDLELVSLEGQSGPIWSVVDPGTLAWLYSVNAATGDEVPNPHG